MFIHAVPVSFAASPVKCKEYKGLDVFTPKRLFVLFHIKLFVPDKLPVLPAKPIYLSLKLVTNPSDTYYSNNDDDSNYPDKRLYFTSA